VCAGGRTAYNMTAGASDLPTHLNGQEHAHPLDRTPQLISIRNGRGNARHLYHRRAMQLVGVQYYSLHSLTWTAKYMGLLPSVLLTASSRISRRRVCPFAFSCYSLELNQILNTIFLLHVLHLPSDMLHH